ncbi:MAG: hypothetical protein ACRENY_05515 [Candidatus Dormibacteria bacterium]
MTSALLPWEPADPEPLGLCRRLEFSRMVLGAGSNCLILDGGIPGLVLHFPPSRARSLGAGLARLGAGAMLPRAAFDTAYLGVDGLAFGVGIPGTAELGQVLEGVDAVLPDGQVRRFSA